MAKRVVVVTVFDAVVEFVVAVVVDVVAVVVEAAEVVGLVVVRIAGEKAADKRWKALPLAIRQYP